MKFGNRNLMRTVCCTALCVGIAIPAIADPIFITSLPKDRPSMVAASQNEVKMLDVDLFRTQVPVLGFSTGENKADLTPTKIDRSPHPDPVLIEDIDRAVLVALDDHVGEAHDAKSDMPQKDDADSVNLNSSDLTALVGPVSVDYQVEKQEIDISTSDIRPSGYRSAKERYNASLMRKDSDGSEALEYLRFLVGSMMIAEARSFVHDLEKKKETKTEALAYGRALDLITGDVTDKNASSPFVWSEGSLWADLEEARTPGRSLSSDSIRRLASKLAQQSAPIGTHLTPVLFDYALRAEDEQLARMILNAAFETTDLPGTSTFLLMQGQLATLENEDQRAFDLYATAARGSDIGSAQAKLALAEFALSKDRSKYLAQARDILDEAQSDWKGDDTGLRLLTKLAEISEEMSELPDSLEVMHEIATTHPGTSEAELAEKRIPILLGYLTKSIEEQDVSVEQAVIDIRRLEPLVSQHSGWFEARYALALRLSNAGLFQASLAELSEIVADETHTKTADSDLLSELKLTQAKLAVEHAPHDVAVQLVSGLTNSETPALYASEMSLRLRLDLVNIKDKGREILVAFENAPQVLFDLAHAADRSNDLGLVADSYEKVSLLGEELSPADVATYIRATSRLGRKDQIGVSKTSKGNDDLVALGRGISNPMPLIAPLSQNTSYTMLERTGAVLDHAVNLTHEDE